MAERKSTGGTREFTYTNEDMQRIRSTDTESTKAFKDSYRKWQEQRTQDKILEKEMQRRRNILLGFVIMLILFVIMLLAFKYF